MTVLATIPRTFEAVVCAACVAIHERVWERPGAGDEVRPIPVFDPSWKPRGTYGLLLAMVVVYGAQLAVFFSFGADAHNRVFPIRSMWWLAPWTLVTSTFSHSLANLFHLLINGLVLYFFGPHLERLLGTRRFVVYFMVAGAITGALQVLIQPGLALGASGAINMVFGALVIIMPQARVLLYGIIPIRFWMAAIGFAALDVLGAFGYGAQGIGNVAHLSGLALGLWLGYRTRQDLAARGLRVQH